MTASTAPKGAALTEEVRAGLKDFQRRTVDFVFERLFAPGSSGRFLVADEVGLGKTLIARGVVARVVDRLRGGSRPASVLYICSNGDIARQNIQRLKLSSDGHVALASRLTMLPLQLGKLTKESDGVNFISFTPATSFDLRDGLGQSMERALLYWMVREAWDFGGGKAAQHVFRGHVGADRFSELLGGFDRSKIDAPSQQTFGRALSTRIDRDSAAGEQTLRQRFDDLTRAFSRSDRSIDHETNRKRNRFIGDLRSLLAASCVAALNPDLVVLDEFQRFSRLLVDSDDEASALARAVFEFPNVRVLLLSATPYKMYTHAEEGEDHYRDFIQTVRFLERNDGMSRAFAADLDEYRSALLGVTQPGGVERVRAANLRLEVKLRSVMVRTERLASTPDRNGMLVPREMPLQLRTTDALDFVAVQRVARAVKQHDAFDYWKSTPYALNFLDNAYKLKSELRTALGTGEGRTSVARALSASPTASLPWADVLGYREVDPGNPRMRALLQDFLDAGAHRLLWIPPSLPYYALGGAFADPASAKLTKRLVFSSWGVVPGAIASMVSYEVERRIFSGERGADYTPEYRASRRRALQFSRDATRRLTGMAVLALLYPSLYLAEACDPATLAAEVCQDRKSVDATAVVHKVSVADVLDAARVRIEHAIDKHLPPPLLDGPVDERWYWAAPLLLDRKLKPDATAAWFRQPKLAEEWSGATDDAEEVADDPNSGRARDRWAEHVDAAREVARDGAGAATSADGPTALGRRPDDLVEVLAQLAIGGPAVTTFRSLRHVVGDDVNLTDTAQVALRNGAGRIAWAFRALFNQPEVITLLRRLQPKESKQPYWRMALAYCVEGCLQSVIDEYVHVLRDHLGLLAGTTGERVLEIADEVVEAIALRMSSVGIDEITPSEAGRTVSTEPRKLRTHFALRFGDERADNGEVVTRKDQVRKAFNSPFWPFVLATTSVGQEGLDFHTYCHAVVHWNLPSNPVDFEQREGRVHRYKGHAVRKNVATAHGEAALVGGARDRWETMFRSACDARPDGASDIVPYWICLDGEARIERHVPSLPLSADLDRTQRLLSSLAVYRMVFGQPRQQDLVAYLLDRIPKEDLERLMVELRIDLSPPGPADPATAPDVA